MTQISASDISVFSKYAHPSRSSWLQIPAEDQAVYVRIHRFLQEASKAVVGPGMKATLTSGFHERTAIRNSRPKDLWCAISNDPSDRYLGNPQVYMTVSPRGVEIGFAAATHRADFSNQDFIAKVRAIVPELFDHLPEPNDPKI
jgi:hypothetical protein